MFETMRAAAPFNGVASASIVGAEAGLADEGVDAEVETMLGTAEGLYPAKNSRHDSATEEGSARNRSYMSSTSQALGPNDPFPFEVLSGGVTLLA